MSGLLLPQGLLDELDTWRRDFLWAGDEKASGAQCLVAWEKACQQKEMGGLRIKDLAMKNKCLLLKLLHRATFMPLSGATEPPPKVQFFAWLLVQERIQCRANLLKKNVVQDATCEVCQGDMEDCDHLIFKCPFASSVWASLHVDTTGCSVRQLWCAPCPGAVPEKHSNCFILLICWQLWKHRNGVIFQGLEPSLTRFWMGCREEATLWPGRWPRTDRIVAEAWCQTLSPM